MNSSSVEIRLETFEEIRKYHKGLKDRHLHKLLKVYCMSEIIAGKIIDGTFYPAFEYGKYKNLTTMRLWSPR